MLHGKADFTLPMCSLFKRTGFRVANIQVDMFRKSVWWIFYIDLFNAYYYALSQMALRLRGVQSYPQRASVCAGFHSNQSGAPDSTCLINWSSLSMDYQVWLLLSWNENLHRHWPFVDKIGHSCLRYPISLFGLQKGALYAPFGKACTEVEQHCLMPVSDYKMFLSFMMDTMSC